MTEREAFIALNLLPMTGPVRVRRLLDAFGSPEAALAAPVDRIRSLDGFGPDLARTIAGWENEIDLGRELRRIREIGAEVVTLNDKNYPAPLREMYDPPVVLYVSGTLRESDRHAVSVVGSRRTSNYGLRCAKKLAFQLAHAGLAVVSGLARGIDTAAHEGALAARGRTIAVIGSGLGKLYPPENRALAEKIAQSGAVVTEFPVDYPPDKQSFPLRNRIVAGWGLGVLVVEAPGRSGALITANQAADCGRTVFAVPGPIDRPTSQGTNRLIQNGARLVMDGADVLEDLSGLFPGFSAREPAAPESRSASGTNLSDTEAAVYKALGDEESVVDELIDRTGLSSSVVTATLLKLEMKRMVKQLPGHYFVRLV